MGSGVGFAIVGLPLQRVIDTNMQRVQSIHFIDLMCWFMGQPKRVVGKIGIYNHDIETEDLGMAMVEFASGAVGSILGTTAFPDSPIAGVHLPGSEGGVITTRP